MAVASGIVEENCRLKEMWVVTLMQKAVLPAQSVAYVEGGYDRVAGFVVPAEAVSAARTPAELFVAHGLGFPGSPVSPADPFLDVLRFEPTPQLRFENATGGTTEAERQLTGGAFVDRPPFTGTGFVAAEGMVIPLYWLVHSRIPAGAELVRYHADGREELVARYVDVVHGWRSGGTEKPAASFPPVSRFVGPMARWNDTYFSADLVGDEVVLVAESESARELGFERASTGRWFRRVARAEVTELFEMYVTAKVAGVEVRVVDQWTQPDGVAAARVTYLGHNADIAEGLQLTKVDAGVYEASVAVAQLQDVVTSQLVPTAWQA